MAMRINALSLFLLSPLFLLSCVSTTSNADGSTAPKSSASAPKDGALTHLNHSQIIDNAHPKNNRYSKMPLYIVKLSAPALAAVKSRYPEFTSITLFKKSAPYQKHQKVLRAQRAEFIEHLNRIMPAASVVRFHEFATNAVVVKAPLKSQAALQNIINVKSVHIDKNQNLIK